MANRTAPHLQTPARPGKLLEPCVATSRTHSLRGPRRSNAPGLPDNRVHWLRYVTFDEDRHNARTGSSAQVLATLPR